MLVTFLGRACVIERNQIFLKESDGKYYKSMSALHDIYIVLIQSRTVTSSSEYSFNLTSEMPGARFSVIPPKLTLYSFLLILKSLVWLFKFSLIPSGNLLFSYYPNSIAALISFACKCIPLLNCKFVNYYGGDYDAIILSGNYPFLCRYRYKFFYALSRYRSRLNICAGPVLAERLRALSSSPTLITKPFLSINQSSRIFIRTPSERSLNICFVGVFSSRKGFHLLPQILDLINIDSITLHLIGKGPLYETTLLQISKLNNIKTVSYGFLSSPHSIQQIINSCDFLLLPSLAEGFPRVIYEALNAGTMVIARDVGSVSNILAMYDLHDYFLPYSATPLDFARRINLLHEKSRSPQYLRLLADRHQNLLNSIFDQSPAEQHASYLQKL